MTRLYRSTLWALALDRLPTYYVKSEAGNHFSVEAHALGVIVSYPISHRIHPNTSVAIFAPTQEP